MDSHKKITYTIIGLVVALVLLIIGIIAYSSRENGYEGTKKRAYLAAEIVKDALTAHMVNGIMDRRDFFLDAIKSVKGVEDMWIVRSSSVSKQFGKTDYASEEPRDEIDEKVLMFGKEMVQTDESLKKVMLRISIPYVASKKDNPNCLSCHDGKEGDVLGVISIKFDMSDDRMYTSVNLLKVAVTSVIFLIIILWFISSRIKPFTKSFSLFAGVLKNVHEGDYSVRTRGGTFKEDKEASKWLDDIIEKLETVLTTIDKNLTSFISNRPQIGKDKLLGVKEVIADLAEIYSFKKTIETDLNKGDIIYRLSQVIEGLLGIDTFLIFETDIDKDERTLVYRSKDNLKPCCFMDTNVLENCRALRNNSVVQSDNFPEICRIAKCEKNNFVCIPLSINATKHLVVHIVSSSELSDVKGKIGNIKRYFEEAKPILESKILMEILQERNYTDGLTGLKNRKHLEDFVEKTIIQNKAKEDNQYGIMMLDVDYFKMVNDTFGHDAGDRILKQLSNIMKDAVNKREDHVIRYGGEEFLIMVKDPTDDKMKKIATQINRTFGKTNFKFNGETINKTVSIGYAFFPKDSDQFYKTVKYADMSLYEAKETGRNKIVKFTQAILKNLKDEY